MSKSITEEEPARLRADASKLKTIIGSVQNLGVQEITLQLLENKVLLRAMDPGEVLMHAARIEGSFFEEYDRGSYDKIGAEVSSLVKTLGKTSGVVTIDYGMGSGGTRQLSISSETDTVRLAGINPEYVDSGVDSVPSTDFPAVGTIDTGEIEKFTSKAFGIIDSSDCTIRHRGHGIDLYAEKDNSDVYQRLESPTYEPIHFKKSNISQRLPHQDQLDEEDVVESVFSMEFLDSIPFETDGAEMSMGNDTIIRFVYTMYDGVECSWIMSPRIPGESDRRKIPEEVY